MLRKEIYELPQFALVLLKFRFRVPNFFKGASQCFLRSLSLDGLLGNLAFGCHSGIVISSHTSKSFKIYLRLDWIPASCRDGCGRITLVLFRTRRLTPSFSLQHSSRRRVRKST